jgi:hypothetical protein
MAAECSPGRKPGDQAPIRFRSPLERATENVWIADSRSVSSLRGLKIILFFVPRAYARGFTLPPAAAGSLNVSTLVESSLAEYY